MRKVPEVPEYSILAYRATERVHGRIDAHRYPLGFILNVILSMEVIYYYGNYSTEVIY